MTLIHHRTVPCKNEHEIHDDGRTFRGHYEGMDYQGIDSDNGHVFVVGIAEQHIVICEQDHWYRVDTHTREIDASYEKMKAHLAISPAIEEEDALYIISDRKLVEYALDMIACPLWGLSFRDWA